MVYVCSYETLNYLEEKKVCENYNGFHISPMKYFIRY
jgi:hypothetical protein